MGIGGSGSVPPFAGQPAQASALAGLQSAQAQVADGAAQLAAGAVDPAVVLQISAAQQDFAASATVFRVADENTRRLLDVLA